MRPPDPVQPSFFPKRDIRIACLTGRDVRDRTEYLSLFQGEEFADKQRQFVTVSQEHLLNTIQNCVYV